MRNKAYVVGTADTKSEDLSYVVSLLRATGLNTVYVNVGTQGGDEYVDVAASEVAAYHPRGAQAVFSDDRGKAVVEMSKAFTAFMLEQRDVGGVIGLGGSGGTGLITPAMQALPIGVPKVMVSTLASGDVSAYVGASDINMFYPCLLYTSDAADD